MEERFVKLNKFLKKKLKIKESHDFYSCFSSKSWKLC